MCTLFLDTSGPYTTVAIAQGCTVLGASTLRGKPAAQVHDQIRSLLHISGTLLADIACVAVVTGPGSWTGLNIGVTAAKLLAQVLDVHIQPLQSLDVLVAKCTWPQGRVCAMLSAGRGRAYRTWYPTTTSGKVNLKSPQHDVVALDTLNHETAGQITMPLVVEYGANIGSSISARCIRKQVDRLCPQAMTMVAQHAMTLTTQEGLWLTPSYMQPSMAERDITAHRSK